MVSLRQAASYVRHAWCMARAEGARKMLREVHRGYVRRFRPLTTSFKPTAVEWEVTTRCNLDCLMCPRSSLTGGTLFEKNVDPRDFTTLLAKLPFLELVSFRGAGEPILHPRIVTLAEEVIRKGIKLSIFTNGMAMNGEVVERLLALPVSEIVFSIDAGEEETYAGIRRGGDLNRVLANLEAVRQQVTARKNGTMLSVMFILMRTNFREFPLLYRRIQGAGISALVAKHVNPGFNSRIAGTMLTPDEERAFRESYRSLQAGETRVVYSQEMYEDSAGRPRICSNIWELPFITVDGHLSRCPMAYYTASGDYGSLHRSCFEKVWNSQAIKEHRTRIAQREIDLCNACPLMKPWRESAPPHQTSSGYRSDSPGLGSSR